MGWTCFLRAIGLESGAKEPVEATAVIESVVEPKDNSMEILDGILLLVVGSCWVYLCYVLLSKRVSFLCSENVYIKDNEKERQGQMRE